MDCLLDICGPKIWAGQKPPADPRKFLLGFSVSMGENPGLLGGRMDTTFVQTGEGTRVFPIVAGGSLVALLAEEYIHKLTDEVIARIFKQDSSKNEIIEYRGKLNSTAQRSKYVSKLCDPISLLDALLNTTEREVRISGLTLDLFNIERLAIPILSRFSALVKPIFTRLFSAEYQKRTNQLPYLAGWFFMALSGEGGRRGGRPTSDDNKQIMEMLDGVFTSAREGMSFGHVPGVDPINGS